MNFKRNTKQGGNIIDTLKGVTDLSRNQCSYLKMSCGCLINDVEQISKE